MRVGDRIRNARMQKGFTQEYIALQLNVSRQAVSKWEKNLTHPDTKNLIALSKLLDVSVEALLSEIPEEAPVKRRNSLLFSRLATVMLLVGLALYGIGVFSGELNRMVMVFRVGIPFLYYGDSMAAVFLLILSIVFIVLSAILYSICIHIKKEIG